MPKFYCCFCSKHFTKAKSLGNHQWRCVPIENDVSLLPTKNNNIGPLSQQHGSNEVNCNNLEDNDNLFMLAEGYDDDIDDEEYNVYAQTLLLQTNMIKLIFLMMIGMKVLLNWNIK